MGATFEPAGSDEHDEIRCDECHREQENEPQADVDPTKAFRGSGAPLMLQIMSEVSVNLVSSVTGKRVSTFTPNV